MNYLEDLVLKRHSPSKFSDKPIEKGILEHLCRIAQRAPTSTNYQPYKIIISYKPEIIQKIRECHYSSVQPTTMNAIPIIICSDVSPVEGIEDFRNLCEKGGAPSESVSKTKLYLSLLIRDRWYQYYKYPLQYIAQYFIHIHGNREALCYSDKNVGIYVGQLDLLLQSHGIGVRIMESFSDYKLNELLGIPSRYRPTCILWCGYEDTSESQPSSLRYDPQDVIFKNKFECPFESYDVLSD